MIDETKPNEYRNGEDTVMAHRTSQPASVDGQFARPGDWIVTYPDRTEVVKDEDFSKTFTPA